MSVTDPLAEQYRALLEVSESIATHHDLTELFRALAQRLPRVLTFSSLVLGLHDPSKNVMRLHVLEDPRPLPVSLGLEFPVGDVPGGWVWQHQQPLVCKNLEQETRFPKVMPMIRQAGIRSLCIVPLTSARQRLGAMGVGSLEAHHYGQAEIDFLQQVARQVAVAVENVLNFERAHQTEQEIRCQFERERLLLEITNAVVSHLDLRELFKAIAACLRRVIAHDSARLTLFDAASNQLQVLALDSEMTNPWLVSSGELVPIEGTPAGLAFMERRTLLVGSSELEKFASPIPQHLVTKGVKSFVSAPLISHGSTLGTLDLVSFKDVAFSESDVKLITQVADQVAISVENALNFERARQAEKEARRRFERERLMLEINNAVVSHLDLGELLTSISACLRRVIPHDLAGFCIYDAATNRLLAHSLDFPSNQEFGGIGDPIPLEGTPEGVAFTSQKTVLIKNLHLAEFSAEIIQRGAAAGLKSGCAVPLIAHDRALGTLSVVSLRENAFSEDDAELLGNIGRQVAIAIENVLAYQEIANLKDKLNREKLYLEDEIRSELNFEEIIGESAAIKQVLKQVGIVAPTDSTVLIFGETGTGKELLARAIHDRSKRRERTFVKLNCAAIPTGLIESELFGHERGAFTGAIATKVGRFELADGGTLFLDEVGEIPLELQSKLLRVLQEQEFERLGSTRTIKVNVRMLAATNRDLLQMVEGKQFRSDLYYRLNVFPIMSPSLQDRAGDIPLLVRYFTQQLARRMEKRIERIPSDAMDALCRYPWPGNVRELENFIERAVILSQGIELRVPLGELKTTVRDGPQSVTTLQTAERDHILRALEKTNWVIAGPTGAATLLGMKRSTLQSKMVKLGISRRS
ncbi:MAG: sigma 54-interacting transcriptional regulator [Nitrospira sp.]|nr:sigma 54-interacting transcriptional regulator [Nitrospira sp.]MBH0182904.1 sigma 54-interacting transcriptional regulator [Nitrospira sp.]MBH0186209.1 sigma 54-interacting transcriptional regulator [Nitrospira sp.]